MTHHVPSRDSLVADAATFVNTGDNTASPKLATTFYLGAIAKLMLAQELPVDAERVPRHYTEPEDSPCVRCGHGFHSEPCRQVFFVDDNDQPLATVVPPWERSRVRARLCRCGHA